MGRDARAPTAPHADEARGRPRRRAIRRRAMCSEAALVFEDIVGMPLIKVIRSDTRGWFEKTLCYIIREAFEERVHVPPSHVVLVRDIDVAS